MNKIYYVDIYGRENCLWGFRGKRVHAELINARSHKRAKEIAWKHLQDDMDDLWKFITNRKHFRIDSEDVTGSYTFEENKEVYFTSEELERRTAK